MNIIEIDGYTDLGITSTKKPFTTHLFWEHSTYGIFMVDSTDQTKLLKSTKARLLVDGSDWDIIDLSDNTNSYKIQAGWLDGVDLWLVMCDNDGTADDFEVCFIEMDDSDDCNPVAVSAGADINTVYAYDIFKIGANHYVMNRESRAATVLYVVWDVDAAFVEKANIGAGVPTINTYGLVTGNDFYFMASNAAAGGSVFMYLYDDTIPSITLRDSDLGTYQLSSVPNQLSLAYDGNNIIYFILDSGGLHYLGTYTIDTDTIAGSTTVQNIALMLDRNTASGVMEKAFHITEDKIYQLHPIILHQFHLIAVPDSDAVFIGITDNFLMNDDGDMWEYGDVSKYVTNCMVRRKDMSIPTAIIELTISYPVSTGMFIVIKDMFTTATVSSTEIIFEGYITDYIDDTIKICTLVSPARELNNIFPSGDYAGRSDEIITSLISTYCKYITAGTLSAGGAMGTITFYGDKPLSQILDDLALFDKFIWYLTPTGKLYYNSGAVDSGVDLLASNYIFDVKKLNGKRAINSVVITGAFISGVQVTSDGSHVDQPDIDLSGVNPFRRTHSHLDTNALCNTTATNILTRFGTQALLSTFGHVDITIGLIQEGETLTLTYSVGGVIIAETQFGIREINYDAFRGRAYYKVSDRII